MTTFIFKTVAAAAVLALAGTPAQPQVLAEPVRERDVPPDRVVPDISPERRGAGDNIDGPSLGDLIKETGSGGGVQLSAEQLFNLPCAETEADLRLTYEVVPRFPMPPDGDPAKVVMPNDMAYVQNSPAPKICYEPRCVEDQMRVAVRFEVGSTMEPSVSRVPREPELMTPESGRQLGGDARVRTGQQLPRGVDTRRDVQEEMGDRLSEARERLSTTRYTLRLRDPDARIQYRSFARVTDLRTGERRGGSAAALASDLPQGLTKATLRVDRGDSCAKANFDIMVDDILVVALGDSYASGEGAPIGRVEPVMLRSSWLPPLAVLSNSLYNGGAAALWARSRLGETPLRSTDSGSIRLYAVDDRALDFAALHHHLAHRSPFASSARVAMDLEEESQQSSVTYVSFAVSGATIDRGVRTPSVYPEPPLSEIERLNERWRETELNGPLLQAVKRLAIQQVWEQARRAPEDQIEALGRVAAGREIDILLLGFGGNDAGFARVADQLVRREGDAAGVIGNRLSDIRRAIRDGDWLRLREDYGYNVAGIDRLSSEYEYLARRIEGLRTRWGVTVKDVYLVGYPDPTRLGDRACEFFTRIADRRSRLANAVELIDRVWDPSDYDRGMEISSEEAVWARDEFLKPLANEMECAAEQHGWRFVPMPSSAFRNGICGAEPYGGAFKLPNGFKPKLLRVPDRSVRWFRAGAEAFYIQSSVTRDFADGTGLLHPNEHGYRAIADEVQEAIRGPRRTSACVARPPTAVEDLEIPVTEPCLPGHPCRRVP